MIAKPGIDDDAGWCRFCFGNKLRKKLATNDKTVDAIGLVAEESESFGSPPLLSIVTAMSQPLIERVLDYHISWFEATGFTPKQVNCYCF